MLTDKDIYTHLKNGGSIEDLKKAFENEIHNAQDRIIKEKDAELKEKAQTDKINKARATAHKAMKSYFTLVNPKVDDKMIDIALDALKDINFEINIIDNKNGRGKRAEIKGIWNDDFFRFPF